MLHIPASRTASCLALMGLVPFIVPAMCLWFVAPGWQPLFAQGLVAYGALILAFMGGLHWGAALKGDQTPAKFWQYAYGIMPALLAFVVLMCPTDKGLFLLFLGYMATFFIDRHIFEGWFRTLRAILTMVVCLCLYAAYKAI